jgi:hypothetical protein
MDGKKYISAKPCWHCGCEQFSETVEPDGTLVLTCWNCQNERRIKPPEKPE